jgi:phosphoribosyl-ATP pyrophosphohydrolase
MNNGDFKPVTAMGSAINGMAADIHCNAVMHGFYEEADDMIAYLAVNDLPGLVKVAKTNFVLAQIAKIASEAGEAVSAIQHGNWNELPEELADIVIRTLDLAAYLGYPIGDVIIAKMEKNKNRPYKHGKEC